MAAEVSSSGFLNRGFPGEAERAARSLQLALQWLTGLGCFRSSGGQVSIPPALWEAPGEHHHPGQENRLWHIRSCRRACWKGTEALPAWPGSSSTRWGESHSLSKLCTCHDWLSCPERAPVGSCCHPGVSCRLLSGQSQTAAVSTAVGAEPRDSST